MNRVMPEGVKNLLIINGIMFLAMYVLERQEISLIRHLALYNFLQPDSMGLHLFKPWQLLTHLFMHGSLSHIFFNMLSLWMFGAAVEQIMGTMRFIFYYLVCGFGASLLHVGVEYLLNPMADGYIPMVGASGAVYGLLLAFGMFFPNELVYFNFFIPIKAKYFVAILGALELFSGYSNESGDNVAHFAHLGGIAVGFLLILWFRRQQRQ